MPALNFILTNAGKAAIVNAVNTGTDPVVIDRVAIGSVSWTPTAAATALNTEIKKITAIGGGTVADDTIHVTANDSSSDTYTVREIGLYTDGNVLLAIYSQADPIITKGAGTVALIAADLVITGVPAGSVTVGDTTFDYPQATETVKGVAELATVAETQAGTDDERIVTPAKLAAASTSEKTASRIVKRDSLGGFKAAIVEVDQIRSAIPFAPLNVMQQLWEGVFWRMRFGGDEDEVQGFEVSNFDTPTIRLRRNGRIEFKDSRVTHPTDATSVLDQLWAGNYWRVRFGGSDTGLGLEITDYDDVKIRLRRNGNIEAVSFIGPLTGNASTASALATARTISLGGDLSGSASFSGAANITISATVASASTTTAGKVELATNTETQTGTDGDRAVTPSSLSSRTATTTRTGLIELATQAEVDTGTDTERAVTPQTMRLHPGVARAWVNFNGSGTVEIRASHGVSSITDRGVGRYTINWDGVFGSANYCFVACARQINDVSDSCTVSPRLSETKSSGSLQITVTEGADVQDSTEICVAAFA